MVVDIVVVMGDVLASEVIHAVGINCRFITDKTIKLKLMAFDNMLTSIYYCISKEF
jgi:hypothetical protein